MRCQDGAVDGVVGNRSQTHGSVPFNYCQTSPRFHAQLVLNHDDDANLEPDAFYEAFMDTLQTNGEWVDPTEDSSNSIKYFEQTYENDPGFKSFVIKRMLPLLERYNVYNNPQP